MSIRRWQIALVIALVSAGPTAAETSTFTYDALGRLVATSISGGPRNGRTDAQRYDPAGNRSGNASGQPLPTETTAVTFALSGPGTVTKGTDAVFQIAKTGPAAATVTLNYATANGTATAPTDYAAVSATLSFLAWETLKNINIPTTDDGLASSAKTFSVSISSPSTGGSITTASATATIAASAGSAPIANNDSAIVGICSGKYIDVTANDSDPSGGYPLTVIAVTAGTLGTATITSASTIRYQAFGGTGSDAVTYTVRNTAGHSATATLALDIRDLGGCQ